jgi:hypothetical protein
MSTTFSSAHVITGWRLSRTQPVAPTVSTFSTETTGYPRLSTSQSHIQSYVMTDGQSASLSRCQAPPGAHDQIFVTVRQFRVCWSGARSLTRAGLSFTIAAGPCQRSHSRVRVPRDSWPYFTISDSRLPQTGGPGSRICTSQEQRRPVIVPGTGFPFRQPRHSPNRKRCFQQFFNCCMCIRRHGSVFCGCRGNVCTYRCLAMDNFSLKYSGFQPSCHNIHIMFMVYIRIKFQRSRSNSPLVIVIKPKVKVCFRKTEV